METTKEAKKYKPEQLLFIGHGRRNVNCSIIKWKGRNGRPDSIIFQFTDPIVRGEDGYPLRISVSQEFMTEIYLKASEKDLLVSP